MNKIASSYLSGIVFCDAFPPYFSFLSKINKVVRTWETLGRTAFNIIKSIWQVNGYSEWLLMPDDCKQIPTCC